MARARRLDESFTPNLFGYSEASDDLASAIRRARKEQLPNSEAIVNEAFEELGFSRETLSKEVVQRDFNALLHAVWRRTLSVLERYEEPTYGGAVITELTRIHADDIREARRLMQARGDDNEAFEVAIQRLLKKWYPELRTLFLSVSQSRKSRGGKDWELQIGRLLQLMDVGYEPTHVTYRVDFMIPSYEHYQRNRNQCIILSAKRTLRERWQEVVDELHKMNCPNVYLATAEDRISLDKKNDIWRRNIYLVVWDEVKARYFPDDDSVVSYSHLSNVILPHYSGFWTPKGQTTP